ncbi:MAG: OmpA family protein [Marinomonas atlantica]|nr:OmpA family protein [Marinomonas atlantica]
MKSTLLIATAMAFTTHVNAQTQTDANVMDYYCHGDTVEFQHTVTVGPSSTVYLSQNGHAVIAGSTHEEPSLEVVNEQVQQHGNIDSHCVGYFISLGTDSKAVEGQLAQLQFEKGSAELTEKSRYTLYKLLPRLRRSTHLIIEGHADFLEVDRKAAFELGAKRAQAVADYIKERDAAPYDLLLMSKGASAPKADSNSALGRVINRRVELRE